MEPKEVAKLISENIGYNNGLDDEAFISAREILQMGKLNEQRLVNLIKEGEIAVFGERPVQIGTPDHVWFDYFKRPNLKLRKSDLYRLGILEEPPRPPAPEYPEPGLEDDDFPPIEVGDGWKSLDDELPPLP